MNPVQSVFRAGAALRRARTFHPTGQLFDATLVVEGDGPLPQGEQEVPVRLSKGAGLPGPVPDFLGLAFRAQEGNRPIDVLCTTAVGLRGWRRLLLFPAARWSGARLSTLMHWQREDESRRHVQVGAEVCDSDLDFLDPTTVADHLPVQIRLQVSDRRDRVLQRGELVLVAPRRQGDAQMAFDPMRNHPLGWQLGPGWLASIREAAYVGSRRGRPS